MTATAKPDLRLYAFFEESRHSLGAGYTRYAHMRVQPLVLAPDDSSYARSQGRTWDLFSPDTYQIELPAEVRQLRGLRIDAQIDEDKGYEFYGYRISYQLD